MILPAVITAATGMMLSMSPAQAETSATAAVAHSEGAEPNPLGSLVQGGPISLPEPLIQLLPFGKEV
ncbi:hypothetical protein GCM10010254_07890 [Streptomyces chromofuscus]|nr:hypothetical protein GCM10010254_07890 [Streptomyces chromofuscus]